MSVTSPLIRGTCCAGQSSGERPSSRSSNIVVASDAEVGEHATHRGVDVGLELVLRREDEHLALIEFACVHAEA